MRIKLLMYAHDWFPVLGGIQTVTLALATSLTEWGKTHARESFEVKLVTQTAGNGMDDTSLPFKVVRRPSVGKLVALIRWADVIDLAGPALFPLAVTWMLRKSTVLEHHGYQSICPNGLLVYEPQHCVCPGHFMAAHYRKCLQCNKKEMGLVGSIRNLCLAFPRRWLAKQATVNVGVSPHVAQRVKLPRTLTIWNGVTVTTEPRFEEEQGADRHGICFGYLGRLVTEKGLPVLLRAGRDLAAKGHHFRFRIVGDGPERVSLEKMAQAYGLADRTEFVGAVPASGIREALRGVSVVVMPSVWEDVAPLVAMEQMMEGRLLIASDIGGLGQIANGSGLKFPAGDVEALKARMLEVLEDPAAVLEMRKRCRNRAVDTFSLGRMVEQHVETYRSVADRK